MDWMRDPLPLLCATLLLGFAIGFLLGKTVGLARGRDVVIQKVKGLVVKGKVDFNIEDILRAELRGKK
jgi:hypothetical protein